MERNSRKTYEGIPGSREVMLSLKVICFFRRWHQNVSDKAQAIERLRAKVKALGIDTDA